MTTATVGKKNPKYKWEVLALLWVAYLLNQADRQIFNVVLPLIREDLGLSDVAVGTIATVFNLFYAVLVPIGGFIGDRFSRKWIVTASVLFWSIATMFTGLCNGFLMLVVMRSIATGGGEAFFGPANYSLIADYHDRTRAFAMSIHQTAYYVVTWTITEIPILRRFSTASRNTESSYPRLMNVAEFGWMVCNPSSTQTGLI